MALLLQATAGAFQSTVPSTRGLSLDDWIKLFAQFTREQADKSIQNGNSLEVQSRLFQNARLLGQQFKADFNLNSM